MRINVLQKIANAFGIKVATIYSKTRNRNIVEARWAYIFYLRKYLGCKLKEIGDELGMDHSSIIYSLKSFHNLYKLYPDFRLKVKRAGLKPGENFLQNNYLIKTNNEMIIAIDFDGTIVRGEYPAIAGLMPYAAETIRAFKNKGHYLIINTCRTGDNLLSAINYLLEHNIPFDRVNDNNPENTRKYNGSSRKIYAHVYIDDKNLGGFPGWLQAEDQIKELEESLKIDNEQ